MVGRHKAVAERKLEWRVTSQIGAHGDARVDAQDQSISDNQIHLWWIDVQKLLDSELDSAARAQYRQLLAEPEITCAKRIINDVRRQRYLGGRAGLRILLSGYTGIVNTELEFGYGNRGKPKLLNAVKPGKLEFNYTLSSRFALYAFSLNRALGIDLEVFPRTVAAGQLAKRILTDLEQAHWRTLQKEQQNEAMLACWTRKEAYGKVLGVGIRYAMNRVNLFTGLHQDRWRTKVSGLFAKETSGETIGEIHEVSGVQLGLPVAGVASLMYSETADEFTADECNSVVAQGVSRNIEPELRAFRLQV